MQYFGLDGFSIGRLCAPEGLCSIQRDELGYEHSRKDVHICQERRNLFRSPNGMFIRPGDRLRYSDKM